MQGKPTTRWRLAVTDGGETRHYPMDTPDDIYTGWRTLHAHARDGVDYKVQRLLAGHWVDVDMRRPGGAA